MLLRLPGNYLLYGITSVLPGVKLYKKILIECFPLDPKQLLSVSVMQEILVFTV